MHSASKVQTFFQLKMTRSIVLVAIVTKKIHFLSCSTVSCSFGLKSKKAVTCLLIIITHLGEKLRIIITQLGEKLWNVRLRWYGHVKRREEDYVGKRMMEIAVPGRRKRGRPRRRWMDLVREDMERVGAREGDEVDRVKWRLLSRCGDPE